MNEKIKEVANFHDRLSPGLIAGMVLLTYFIDFKINFSLHPSYSSFTYPVSVILNFDVILVFKI